MFRTLWAIIDAVIWVGATYVAMWMRLDFAIDPSFARGTTLFAAVAVIGQLVIGFVVGPYAVGHIRGSFEEVVDLGITVGLVGLGLFAWALLADPVIVPRGVPITGAAIAILAMFAARFVLRTIRAHLAVGREAQRRVIVFGAGEAGRRLLRSMAYDQSCGYVPVALLDDDRAKSRLRMEGLKVRGGRSDIAAVAGKYEADTLVLALPNAEAGLLRDLAERAAAAGLDVLSLPPLREIIGGRPTPNDLRNLDVTDLLGRRPIQLDPTVIAEQISGRTILVTGAGGSIGSELCRQITRFGPGKLYLLDRDESGLQATQIGMIGNGLLDTDEVVLCDIRDPEALKTVFEATRPDVVFHAAALKHLPLLEAYPLEAWKSNVLGTLNVLTAAAAVGVGTFVNVSTDKAANPTCVLGYSKRVAERLTADFSHREKGRYVSVRFGNVLGSRGSVVHAFTAQIEQGGPVTVTHPDVERYFMLIPEACQLVLEAGAIGNDGEVMVLEMGEQVRIVDVANTLIRMSGRTDIDIIFSGLRPGEKLGEDLFSEHEGRRKTAHPLVDSVDVPRLGVNEVWTIRFDAHGCAAQWMRETAMVGQRAVAETQSA
ncbi:MAG: polysaccharide biosynthesis protein [Intrasporangium sp.]|uniref:nucleoside-diphosphate sugar epimerase/dehydratase n=1 Tax=Intrasporangium sp. TaxID=1925024 RepID=UPI002649B975|nr:nucleoside-diphosphate sugar epimerase/dehydratase [Intrasporangium sp.]MDN5794747.1 polysaccharide biosynthesis protein [Intrasporangium sp.]